MLGKRSKLARVRLLKRCSTLALVCYLCRKSEKTFATWHASFGNLLCSGHAGCRPHPLLPLLRLEPTEVARCATCLSAIQHAIFLALLSMLRHELHDTAMQIYAHSALPQRGVRANRIRSATVS